MLYRELLSAELDNKLADFKRFDSDQKFELAEYLKILDAVKRHTSAEVGAIISEKENIGALPSNELDDRQSFSIPFSESWENHEQAREWANSILNDRTTFAADASQILPGRDISIPVAAVQVGWFENPHNDLKNYEKNADFRVLSPQELLEGQEEPMNPESRVGEIRFCAEVDRILSFLLKKKGWEKRGEKMPLAFFDNTFLVSFSMPQTSLQNTYVEKSLELINFSIETRVPVVGFIDRSYSRDILNMLGAFSESEITVSRTLFDSTILRPQVSQNSPVLAHWGDRSIFCFSKRKGLDAFNDQKTGKSLVGFSYLQTTSDSLPARIDVPSWVFDENMLNEVVDVVRAECVIGLGYPYAIETADQTAVISPRDQQIFFGALQEFASRGKLSFSVSRKSSSKKRRR